MNDEAGGGIGGDALEVGLGDGAAEGGAVEVKAGAAVELPEGVEEDVDALVGVEGADVAEAKAVVGRGAVSGAGEVADAVPFEDDAVCGEAELEEAVAEEGAGGDEEVGLVEDALGGLQVE